MASCFCSNWQLVKQLRRLRYLQLLVQVLKAPAINLCFPVAFLSKTEKAGGDTEELVTDISSDQVDKRDRTPFNRLSSQ